MKAKDTVMNWDEATKTRELTDEDIFHCEQSATIGLIEDDNDAQQDYEAHYKVMVELMQRYKAAEAQADISFKAGIKGVVEWGNEKCMRHGHVFRYKGELCSSTYRRECTICWQAFLKEKGIEKKQQ